MPRIVSRLSGNTAYGYQFTSDKQPYYAPSGMRLVYLYCAEGVDYTLSLAELLMQFDEVVIYIHHR